MSNQITNIFLMSIIEIIGDFSYKFFAYTDKTKYLIGGIE